MGEKTEQILEDHPSYVQALIPPGKSEEALSIYNFICEWQSYTVDKGVGMGATIGVIPDMVKLMQIGKEEGVDIFIYKEYCFEFISKKAELEQKNIK